MSVSVPALCCIVRVRFADIYDKVVRTLSKTLGITAFSVDYRLAPEHPHPAPLDDCETALRYLMTNARQWGVDPSRIALIGALRLSVVFTRLMRRIHCTVSLQ